MKNALFSYSQPFCYTALKTAVLNIRVAGINELSFPLDRRRISWCKGHQLLVYAYIGISMENYAIM